MGFWLLQYHDEGGNTTVSGSDTGTVTDASAVLVTSYSTLPGPLGIPIIGAVADTGYATEVASVTRIFNDAGTATVNASVSSSENVTHALTMAAALAFSVGASEGLGYSEALTAALALSVSHSEQYGHIFNDTAVVAAALAVAASESHTRSSSALAALLLFATATERYGAVLPILPILGQLEDSGSVSGPLEAAGLVLAGVE